MWFFNLQCEFFLTEGAAFGTLFLIYAVRNSQYVMGFRAYLTQ